MRHMLALTLGVVLLSASAAQASIAMTDLHNTGVTTANATDGSNSGPLVGLDSKDPNWLLTRGTLNAFSVFTSGLAAAPGSETDDYMKPGETTAGGQTFDGQNKGDYFYFTTFTLPANYLAGSANLTGMFSADDGVKRILFNSTTNGEPAPIGTYPPVAGPAAFSVTDGVGGVGSLHVGV